METTQGETKMNPQEIDTQIQDKRIELGKLFDKEGRTILGAINRLSWVRDQFDNTTDELTEVGEELRDAFFGTYRGRDAGYFFRVSGSDRAGVVNAKIRAFEIVENNNPEVVTEKLSAVRAEISELQAEIAELNASYTGWTRWELCLGGHLHKCTQGARCHSLDKGVSGRSMTAWLPQFSGMEWTEVASQLGDATVVCSHCVPEAPVEYHTKREEGICEGSRQEPVAGGSRQGFMSGNHHTCPVCQKRIGGTGRMVRKHKVGSGF